MKSFLEHVADDIIQRFGSASCDRIDLTDIAVVFPNKRASLFLNQYLYKAAGNRPIWCPQYITISNLFRSQSERTLADPILANCILYDVFSRFLKPEYDRINAAHPEHEPMTVESLDRFWSWGEIMLADFDDLDKNLGDADLIFNNVRDLEHLRARPEDYLTEEQLDALTHFFNLVATDGEDSERSILQRNFALLWNNLGRIYHEFNAVLRSRGLAYEGALYREVAEHAEALEWNCKKYLFVGFNMTQKVEQCLFESMKRQGLALFYWDYDNYYADKEAGRFIDKKLLARFPNELASKGEVFENFRRHGNNGQPVLKSVTYLSAATENIQARYISQWLTEEGKHRLDPDQRTAIVLSDEALLKNVIHCLPAATSGKANITVGFPLSQSPVTSLVKNFLLLHRDGYDLRKVSLLLRHPYISFLSPKAAELLEHLLSNKIFFPKEEDICDKHNPDPLDLLLAPCSEHGERRNRELLGRMLQALKAIAAESERQRVERSIAEGQDPELQTPIYEEQFMQESLFRMNSIITRLHDMSNPDDTLNFVNIDITTLIRVLDQIVRSTTMPFHGEPAVNLQIMGVLETRNLDFDHLLILSCNEGNLPKGINDSSLIPHIVRKAHSLTTADNKVAIYAYYFYRLLQRCDDISIAYNSSTEDGHTGQMSRFMLQMMVENEFINLRQLTLTARQTPESGRAQEIKKEGRVLEALERISSLSPSAINRYLRCPLQFYYEKLAGLRESQEEEFIDSRQFGTIFHAAAENIYRNIQRGNGEITPDAIKVLLSKEGEPTVDRFIDDAFREKFFNGRKPRYDGMQTINREVIKRFIIQLLKADLELAPFNIVGLEQNAYENMTFTMNDGSERRLQIGGNIDRLDCIPNPENPSQRILRVVDYKTGRSEPALRKDVGELFDPKNIDQHADYLLQTMLYSVIVRHNDSPRRVILNGEAATIPPLNTSQLSVSPALLYIQKAGSVSNPIIKFGTRKEIVAVNDVLPFEATFRTALGKLVAEIFDPTTPFRPTEFTKRCENCPYKSLCKC